MTATPARGEFLMLPSNVRKQPTEFGVAHCLGAPRPELSRSRQAQRLYRIRTKDHEQIALAAQLRWPKRRPDIYRRSQGVAISGQSRGNTNPDPRAAPRFPPFPPFSLRPWRRGSPVCVTFLGGGDGHARTGANALLKNSDGESQERLRSGKALPRFYFQARACPSPNRVALFHSCRSRARGR